MNFSKKLLALFLLFFIPVFGMNGFNVVNNKQNQILIDDSIPCLEIDGLFVTRKEYNPENLKVAQYVLLNFSVDTSLSTPENQINIENIKYIDLNMENEEGGQIISDVGNRLKPSSEETDKLECSMTFVMTDLDINTKYNYNNVYLVGELQNGKSLSSKNDPENNIHTFSFETGDPNAEPVLTINASSIKTNSVHLDFKLTNDDWNIIDSNGIKLNLYKKGDSQSTDELIEPIDLTQIDNLNYFADLKGLESNTDYYINGSINFIREFDPASTQTINIDNYDFKTLKTLDENITLMIWIIILLLLIILIIIMSLYFKFSKKIINKIK